MRTYHREQRKYPFRTMEQLELDAAEFMLDNPNSSLEEVADGINADPKWLAWAVKNIVDEGLVDDLRPVYYKGGGREAVRAGQPE